VPRVLDFDKLSLHSLDKDVVSVVPPRSSVVVYYAPAASGFIRDLAAAFSTSDERHLRTIGREMRASFDAQPKLSEKQALERLRAAECLFDVRYSSKTIAENFGLIGQLRFATVTLSYIGIEAIENDFKILEYITARTTPGYEYLIARRAPVLTDLEKAALKKVPNELLEITVGKPVASDTMKEVADFIAREVEKAKQTRGCMGIPESIDLQELGRMLQSGTINPTGTAHALMRAREDLFFRSQHQER
jgi:hypothetical protein